uniref:C2H2-type domain-containing protein n=1 Tax=Hucho hucho TaxID=62062 RepID=A0A4W5MGH6_9TELE
MVISLLNVLQVNLGIYGNIPVKCLPGESKYLCTQCGRSFHRASGLSKHLKRHQPRPDVRGFPCSHCDRSFFEAKDLQQHMNKHLGLKPFQCQVGNNHYYIVILCY